MLRQIQYITICIIVITHICVHPMTPQDTSIYEGVYDECYISQLSYGAYFGILATAQQCATRRYFIPEIRTLINAYNDQGSFYTPQNAKYIIFEHCKQSDDGYTETPHWQIAQQIGFHRFKEPSCPLVPRHPLVRWVFPITTHYIPGPECQAHNITKSIYPTPDNCKTPIDDHNGIDDTMLSRALKRIYDNKNTAQNDIFHAYLQTSLYEYFSQGNSWYHMTENVPRDAIQDFNPKKIYNRKEAQSKIRNWARSQYQYSKGTSITFQNELEELIQNKTPDIQFIQQHLKRYTVPHENNITFHDDRI